MKDIFKCLAVIMGTIIGAGFASGKEIISFFNTYGNNGVLGIIISSIIFGIVTFLSIFVINKSNISKYDELVSNNKLILFIMQFFSIVCFCIMISGVGAFCEQELNINFWYGTAFASAISYAMFLNRFKGIETFSSILVPFIIIGILILGFSNYEGIYRIEEIDDFFAQRGNFWLSAVLYASYNSLILVPILINFRKYNLNNRKTIVISILTTVILGILMLLIYKVNNLFYPKIVNVELPNMLIASMLSGNFKIVYGIIMLVAIFTTAFSCGFSFLEMREKKNYERNALLISILAFLVARIGFSNMINIFFPIFGFFGVFQVILLIVRGVKNEQK